MHKWAQKKQAHMYTHTHTLAHMHTHTRMHARTHARTHTHTHLILACTVRESRRFMERGCVGADATMLPGNSVVLFWLP